jgi:putative two-component system response regulator
VKAIRQARLLIVDDEPMNVLLLEDMLRQAGYHETRSTTDSREALLLAQTFSPDLILLDLMMPDLGGVRVLEELREDPELDETPVIVVTGQVDAVPSMRRVLGDDNVFVKPFGVAELLARVADITGGPGR